MHMVIVVLLAVVGILASITGWIAVFFWGVPFILQLSDRYETLVPLKNFGSAFQQLVNSEDRGPYISFTVLPFVAIAVVCIVWIAIPFSITSALILGFSAGTFFLEEIVKKQEPHERILRYSAYASEVSAFFFYNKAMFGEGKFAEIFAANLATEFGSLSITLLFLDELYRWRDRVSQQRMEERLATERKQNIMQQMSYSRSNDFALEAVRIARNEGWLTDGSLRGINLTRASLWRADMSSADLQNANLTKTNFHRVDLTGAKLVGTTMVGTNLRGAKLSGADLTGAQISAIEFDSYTVWPNGFTPPPDAINFDLQPQQAPNSTT